MKAPNTIIPKTHCNDSIFYLIIFFHFMVRNKKVGIDVAGKLQMDENAVSSPYAIIRMRPVDSSSESTLRFMFSHKHFC